MLEDIHLGVSPISGKVYIGKVKFHEDGLMEFTRKIDRTNEFLATMIEFLKQNGGEIEIFENGVRKYIVKLEEVDSDGKDMGYSNTRS